MLSILTSSEKIAVSISEDIDSSMVGAFAIMKSNSVSAIDPTRCGIAGLKRFFPLKPSNVWNLIIIMLNLQASCS